jgi:hypothetical protein
MSVMIGHMKVYAVLMKYVKANVTLKQYRLWKFMIFRIIKSETEKKTIKVVQLIHQST